ncbi:hypothetical protein NUSPORA_00595 [Nucleospora cyclopteri]
MTRRGVLERMHEESEGDETVNELVVSTESAEISSEIVYTEIDASTDEEIYYSEENRRPVGAFYSEEDIDDEYFDDIQSTESYFQEHIFTYRNFEAISSDETIEDGEINYIFPHLRRTGSKIVADKFEWNSQATPGSSGDLKALYQYILFLSKEGSLTDRSAVNSTDIFRYGIRNFDILSERLEKIITEIKSKFLMGNKQINLGRDFLISNELEIINFQNQRIYGTVIKKQEGNGHDGNLAAYFATEIKEEKMRNSERSSITSIIDNPIVIFDFISNQQIDELRMIFKVFMIIWNSKFSSLLNEFLKYDFPLDSRKFVEKIFSTAQEFLNKHNIPVTQQNEERDDGIQLGDDVLIISDKKQACINFFRRRIDQKWADLDSLIEIIRPGSFFESQFSLFILLYVFYGDVSLVRWLISSLYSEKCFNSHIQKSYTKKDLLRIFKEIAFSKIADETTTTNCVICLGDFKQDAKVLKLHCKHIYHTKCISDWLKENNYCPFCKEKIASYKFRKSECKIRNLNKY